MNSYIIPKKLDSEIDELKKLIIDFKDGTITPDKIKAHRVPFGVYEQRKKGTYMVRVRCAGGFITPSQFQRAAELSSEYGTDHIHLTTRQEVQIHGVLLENITTIMRELRKEGLSTRGGGGNTVRNISVPADAGIDPEELFDVTPYAVALTSRLIAEDESWMLPRKFKVAFSGSDSDKGYATVSDAGFIAKIVNGKKGFTVYAAGGLGSKPEPSMELFDFIPESDVYNVTKALINLFSKYGNRKNKHAVRLRFLRKTFGRDGFIARFREELLSVKEKNFPPLAVSEFDNVAENLVAKKEADDNAGFELWKKRFASQQKQENLFSIILPVELGNLKNNQALKLAQFLNQFGSNVLRLSRGQNLIIRNISALNLGNVYNFLKLNFKDFNKPLILDNIRACTGADTCQLGFCLSKGLASAIKSALEKNSVNLDAIPDLSINISGCPNSCGQHQIADIGFSGKVLRNSGRLYPAYTVSAGAIIGNGRTKLAENITDINARDIPKFTTELASEYAGKSAVYGSFHDYIEGEGMEDIRRISAKYRDIPSFEEDKNYYFDWGADVPFSVAGRGTGECSAGLFDLIELDLANIEDTKKLLSDPANAEKREKLLYNLTLYSSRMLLVTRGMEPGNDEKVFEGFTGLFIESGLVENKYLEIVKLAAEKNFSSLAAKENEIVSLSDKIKSLYESMDNSMNFNSQETAKTAPDSRPPKAMKDLRGVACPMNFVKTKLELSQIKSGELLEILIDDGKPVENVPASVGAEGHRIIEKKKINGHWSVLIEKL